MGADIFESYVGSIVAAIAIAATMPVAMADSLGGKNVLLFLPLALASSGVMSSLLGIVTVYLFARKFPGAALRSGLVVAGIVFVLVAWQVIGLLGVDESMWHRVLAGTICGIVIGLTTEFFTQGSPVRRVAAAPA